MHKVNCYVCKSPNVELTNNAEVYGRSYGNGKCYLCRDCGAYVGVHRKNNKPLGITANKGMRQKKMKCHNLFDPVWKNREIKRGELYRILSSKLNIEVSQCHFGYFGVEQLDRAIDIMSERDWYKEDN